MTRALVLPKGPLTHAVLRQLAIVATFDAALVKTRV